MSPEESQFRFECRPGCTKCCEQPGFVYLTEDDLLRAAAYLGMSPRRFETRYLYRTRNYLRLRVPRQSQCVFLTPAGCSIHPAKPTQCRAYPFWPELVETPETWAAAGAACPGIGEGPLIQIETVRSSLEQMKRGYPVMYAVE